MARDSNLKTSSTNFSSELGCEHFTACSGCTIESNMMSPPVLQRASDFFFRHGQPNFQLHSKDLHGWRHRARMAVRLGADGQPCVGLFASGTHAAVDIPRCQAHHPSINNIADALRRCIKELRVNTYDEVAGKGQLRYVQLAIVESEGGGSEQVQLVLVWNSEKKAGLDPSSGLLKLSSKLWETYQPLLHSIHANFQPSRTNTILGPTTHLLYGSPDTWAQVAGVHIAFDPESFMQANPGAMTAALESMRTWVPAGSRVVDLHAGVGTIGLGLVATQELTSLRLVEINPSAEAAFWKSWKRLESSSSSSLSSVDGRTKKKKKMSVPAEVEYFVATAGSDPGRWLAGADVVVADPPRKGLEPSLLEYLTRGIAENTSKSSSLKRLVYLSCGYPAFERDCSALLESGNWTLVSAEAFLFFPGTDHIETLAVFDTISEAT